VRTFTDASGQSVQYSVVNRDALVDAQRHPGAVPGSDRARSGYSARFVDLSAEVQDTVIARAEGYRDRRHHL
jgi:formate C-acetyltransferase